VAAPSGSVSPQMAGLIASLRAAFSTDPTIRHAADKRLQSFETVPGYCGLLMQIITSPGAFERDTRLLAVVCVHNTVRRHWSRRPGQRRTLYTLPDAERTDLRTKLIAHMTEPDGLVARRLAVVVARVARIDWPRRWPDMLSTLVGHLRTGGLVTDRALFTLFKVIKEKASQARGIGGKPFMELSAAVIPLVSTLWQAGVKGLFAAAYVCQPHVVLCVLCCAVVC